jgi:hypothetical protein
MGNVLIVSLDKKDEAGVSIRVDDRFSIVLERGFDGAALKAALGVVIGAAGR